jgi:hypothetical protein
MSTLAHSAAHPARTTPRRKRRAHAWLILPVALLSAIGVLAAGFVGYVLWPRWPAAGVAVDTPAIPVIVAGTTFNVPPAAIRTKVQRRPGVHERIDLAFLWPSLAAPDPAVKPAPAAPGIDRPHGRIFVTLASGDATLPPEQRLKTIYPRYTEKSGAPVADGLVSLPFRTGTPYQGEDLIYDAQNPPRFAVRCTRNLGPTLGTCLYEQRLGGAEVTVRFHRDWLDDWHQVADGITQLIAGLHPHVARVP